MKRLNRLAALSFLGLLVSASAPAQDLVSIRIGMSDGDAQFLVDGQPFMAMQNFVWPEGSTHVVQFPQVQLNEDTEPYQYQQSGKSRYKFNGWNAVSNPPVTLPGGTVVSITASRGFTELIGSVTKQFPVDFEYLHPSVNAACTPGLEVDQLDRPGVVLIDNNCYAKNSLIWMTAGVHTIQAIAYPGYYFVTMTHGNGACAPTVCPPGQSSFSLRIDNAIHLGVIFARTKRVRFSTNPTGLQVLVDRTPVTPMIQVSDPLNNGDYCLFSQVPIKTPAGVWPLCAGDFDFIPGTSHVIAAQPVQTDPSGEFWVFDKFSNGLGQNGVYVATADVQHRENIEAHFIRGVRSQVDSNVSGLKIVIDGQDVPPSPRYGFIWAEGSTHTLSPPPLQRDSKGRMWRFVSWSDGGEPEHSVTVPIGADGFAVTAFFEILGQVQLTSNPPGLKVDANGAECTTPCTFDQMPGETLSFAARKNVSLGEASRYDFEGWTGLSEALSQQVTFNSDVQTFAARYHGSHRLLAHSDPDNAATFTFSPESSDGYYMEGAVVQVTAKAKTGYKFLRWEEDLNGSRSATDSLTMHGPSSVVARMLKTDEVGPATVRNAAGETPDGTVGPGSIIAIYGESLAAELAIGPTNPLAQAIGDTYVTVNGRILPLIFVSPNQINAQLLSTLGDGEYTLKVHNTGKPDIEGKLTVRRNAPGVFFNVTESGMPLVSALHQDGTPVTEQSPARKGETISFFGTGLGIYDRPTIDGFLLPNTEVYKLLDPVKVVASVPANTLPAGANAAEIPQALRDPAFAGGAPGMVGTNLVKLTIDGDLPPGRVLELAITVNGAQSNKVQLPVQ